MKYATPAEGHPDHCALCKRRWLAEQALAPATPTEAWDNFEKRNRAQAPEDQSD